MGGNYFDICSDIKGLRILKAYPHTPPWAGAGRARKLVWERGSGRGVGVGSIVCIIIYIINTTTTTLFRLYPATNCIVHIRNTCRNYIDNTSQVIGGNGGKSVY